ncbi:hypothetical protein OHA25_20065 [Nonomuraea sp. NBC_00507]
MSEVPISEAQYLGLHLRRPRRGIILNFNPDIAGVSGARFQPGMIPR